MNFQLFILSSLLEYKLDNEHVCLVGLYSPRKMHCASPIVTASRFFVTEMEIRIWGNFFQLQITCRFGWYTYITTSTSLSKTKGLKYIEYGK